MGRKKAGAEAAAQREWELGIDWARWLLAGNRPAPLRMYGLVLEPDEVAYLETNMQYSRLYGGDGRYRHNSGTFIGKPGLVLGMMAATAAVNASRKAAAKRDMQPSWRDVQEVPVVATNLRLICHLPGKGWMSFYYSAVQEFYPDTDNWMITFGFQNAVPLRLAGLPTPTLSVLSAWCVHGNGRWHAEPGIAPLVQAALGPPPAPPADEVPPASTGQLQDDNNHSYSGTHDGAHDGAHDGTHDGTHRRAQDGAQADGYADDDPGQAGGGVYEDLIRSKLHPDDRP
ncbi:hypothetical protein [Kribbella shirazensis]|uniref:Uncharacterized protein n=1 Tax=Kribbella shirazensis TaxID=1105143 RepID=A0A7X6A170_9ACTN|nr:hypothetical protein [Kribbella shirazensis]NIK56839.1 hypothetical protein [Kribbella shirazensis]